MNEKTLENIDVPFVREVVAESPSGKTEFTVLESGAGVRLGQPLVSANKLAVKCQPSSLCRTRKSARQCRLMITGGNGLWVKSKHSSMELELPSRWVSDERPNLISSSFSSDVKS
jgi:hypothetical protein